jgi:hypothetical protein
MRASVADQTMIESARLIGYALAERAFDRKIGLPNCSASLRKLRTSSIETDRVPPFRAPGRLPIGASELSNSSADLRPGSVQNANWNLEMSTFSAGRSPAAAPPLNLVWS